MVGTAHPHRTREANDGWRWWLAKHTPIERETRTMGGVVAGAAHPHRTRDAKDGWRWWLATQTPIERKTRKMGGGGGWRSTPPSNARCERWVELVAGDAHPHRTRDANDGLRWWLVQHTPIEREMRTTGAGGWRIVVARRLSRSREMAVGYAALTSLHRGGNVRRFVFVDWGPTPPSNARCERQEEVVAGKAYTHRTRDAKDG